MPGFPLWWRQSRLKGFRCVETTSYQSLSDLETEAVAEELMVKETGFTFMVLAATLVCAALIWPAPLLTRVESSLRPAQYPVTSFLAHRLKKPDRSRAPCQRFRGNVPNSK